MIIDKNLDDLIIVTAISFGFLYSIFVGATDIALAAMSGLLGFLTGKTVASSERVNNGVNL